MDYVVSFAGNLWKLILEAAPWLAFGLLVAGAIRMWLAQSVLQRWLGGRGIGSILRAALIGTPLPLCSCSTLPTALALRRGGASRGATTSFLIATPENGVDSIALSYALLGPFMAIVRPVAAFICALFAGVLTELTAARDQDKTAEVPLATNGGSAIDGSESDHSLTLAGDCCSASGGGGAEKATGGCCQVEAQPQVSTSDCCGDDHCGEGPAAAQNQAKAQPSGCCEDEGCCDEAGSAKTIPPTVAGRTLKTLRYGFVDFYGDILGWLVVGLLLAALVMTIFPAESISAWGSGLPAMLGMLAIGVPMYICATASTPVAASLLLAGVSPGTVLVFLLAGPATNFASIGVIRRELGTSATAAYLAAIAVGSIVAGLVSDWLVGLWSLDIVAQTEHGGRLVPYWLAVAAAGVLIALAAWMGLRWVWRKWPRLDPSGSASAAISRGRAQASS